MENVPPKLMKSLMARYQEVQGTIDAPYQLNSEREEKPKAKSKPAARGKTPARGRTPVRGGKNY